jgi:hypothetical protein
VESVNLSTAYTALPSALYNYLSGASTIVHYPPRNSTMATEPYRPALDDPTAWVPYRYYPSSVAAIIFVVAFGLTTLLHTFQLVKKKTWYFIPLIIGGLCMSHVPSLPIAAQILTCISRSSRLSWSLPLAQ